MEWLRGILLKFRYTYLLFWRLLSSNPCCFQTVISSSFLLGWGFLDYGYRKRGKWTAITGIVFIVIALLTLWSVRLLILAIVLYIIMKLWKGTPASEVFGDLQKPRVRRSQGMWRNRLFSVQSTPFATYEWEDMHMQGFLVMCMSM